MKLPRSQCIREAADLTVATGTARFSYSRREGDPVPDALDLEGIGFADFPSQQICMTSYYSPTERIAAGMRKRHAVFGRLYIKWRSRYSAMQIKGGEYAVKRSGDGWTPIRELPRIPERHPLWMLGPLRRLQDGPVDMVDGENVRGARTTRFSLVLAEGAVEIEDWRILANPEGGKKSGFTAKFESAAREEIPAHVWIDSEQRVRRMSFVFSQWPQRPPDWLITEFWDFGIPWGRDSSENCEGPLS